ncbi:hypothetical protein [Parazoarcus communis]|nr:hypothetical protein [Parazoarcus communis]NMG71852.1 hypothetical protein [Parazoarcus communis SWub3 = DSM 12120]
MSAEAQVIAIIDQALAVAQQKADESASYADQAITASSGFASTNPVLVSFTPKSNLEPSVLIPNAAAGVDGALYDSTYGRIQADLTGAFTNFFVEYFPNECDYLAKAQSALCAMLDGSTGIPAHVEEQIWQRDRARVLNEVGRSHREVLATFAGRGFPLPPGAAQHQLSTMQQDAQDKVAQQSRDVAIKHVEILIENLRFAVQQALDYRIKGIAAAADYIKTLAIGPEIAMKLATSAADAQARLIGAANSYYGSRIRVEELRFEALKWNSNVQNAAQAVDVNAHAERLKARAQVLAQAAQAAGTQAAAALNAVHASAQVAVQAESA